jgi:pimeloyl-ACP methyl ester carboxylesterase
VLGPVTEPSTVTRSGLTPDWFLDALATKPERRTTRVSGVPISYLAWGPPDAPGLVLVHGGGAHAQWWDHIAPAFSVDRRVLALDLSGHGWSGHCDGYSLDGWTDELLAVAAHGDLCGPPVLVGHSMGGFVTIAAAANHGDEVAGLIVCDSPVTSLDPELSPAAHFGTERKVYPSIEDSLARFRTVPAQDRYLPYVLDHVARASLKAVEGGWTWRFDRRVFGEFAEQIRSIALPHLARVRCPFTLLRSQYGLVTPGIGAAMQSVLPGGASVVELPGAGHHAMLDEPLVLIAALRAVLGEWSRTSGSS